MNLQGFQRVGLIVPGSGFRCECEGGLEDAHGLHNHTDAGAVFRRVLLHCKNLSSLDDKNFDDIFI